MGLSFPVIGILLEPLLSDQEGMRHQVLQQQPSNTLDGGEPVNGGASVPLSFPLSHYQ
jgi:hypothetical protein